MCFEGPDFHWSRDENIFNSYGVNPVQFEMMLKEGTAMKDEFNKESKVFEKTPVSFEDGVDENIDDYHLKLSDFLLRLEYATEKSATKIDLNDNFDNIFEAQSFMNLSFHTADKICFSRNDDDMINSIRLHDMITFNSSVLKKFEETEIQVFIHYPNQLIRSFDKPKYKASFPYLISTLDSDNTKGPKTLEFKISQVQQLRKRSKRSKTSARPCQEDLFDFDRFYKKSIINDIGCIPPYWMKRLSTHDQLEVCASPQQLKNAYLEIKDQSRIRDLKELPCNKMLLLSIDFINSEPSPRPKDIAIKFTFTESTYEEIKYNKMMGFEGWLFNVGGFVGIFLGYSMLQVPEILVYIIDFMRGQKYKSFGSK